MAFGDQPALDESLGAGGGANDVVEDGAAQRLRHLADLRAGGNAERHQLVAVQQVVVVGLEEVFDEVAPGDGAARGGAGALDGVVGGASYDSVGFAGAERPPESGLRLAQANRPFDDLSLRLGCADAFGKGFGAAVRQGVGEGGERGESARASLG